MIVDDSAVIRGLTSRILEEDNSIRVVASVGNGLMAINNLPRFDIDVIVLDIEMPVMDGLTALPKLLEINPDVKILISSTLSARNAEISIRALEAGAADYLPKPTSTNDISVGGEFRRELFDKVKHLGIAHRKHAVASGRNKPSAASAPLARPAPVAAPSKAISLRQAGTLKPNILAVGSSTGGPQALLNFFKGLNTNINMPVVITQHMPATFTAILAGHIDQQTGWSCAEAKDGEELRPGHICLAPGDFHMLVEKKDGKNVIALNQGPQENFCRPSVDPMLRSVAKAYGPNVLTVILTGMGADGMKGSQVIVDGGGTVIAQDEASSVVWGMPGAVATAGLCNAVLPLADLAPKAMNIIAGRFS